jgi:hypothetical protein
VDQALETNSELQQYVSQLEQEADQEEVVEVDNLVTEIEDFLKEN